MRYLIDSVEQEVQRDFPNAMVVRSEGCEFSQRIGSMASDIKCALGTDFQNKTMQKLDAVWIFSDFQDAVEDQVVDELANLLQTQGTKLYLQSLERKPHESLIRACSTTAGNFQTENRKDWLNASSANSAANYQEDPYESGSGVRKIKNSIDWRKVSKRQGFH